MDRPYIIDPIGGGRFRVTLPNGHQEEFEDDEAMIKFLVAVIKSMPTVGCYDPVTRTWAAQQGDGI